jgi:hypothetical protein
LPRRRHPPVDPSPTTTRLPLGITTTTDDSACFRAVFRDEHGFRKHNCCPDDTRRSIIRRSQQGSARPNQLIVVGSPRTSASLAVTLAKHARRATVNSPFCHPPVCFPFRRPVLIRPSVPPTVGLSSVGPSFHPSVCPPNRPSVRRRLPLLREIRFSLISWHPRVYFPWFLSLTLVL